MKTSTRYILISILGFSVIFILYFFQIGSTDVTVIPPQKVDFKKALMPYQLPYRTAEMDSLAGANYVKQLAVDNPGDPLCGEAYYTSGILFSQVAQWDDAVRAYANAVSTGKLSPFQEISAIYAASQCKKYNKDFSGSLDGLKSIYDKVKNDNSMLAELGKVSVKDQTPYFNSLYSLIASSYLEIIDLYEDTHQYEQAATEILIFLDWFDSVHKEKKFFQKDRELNLDSSSPFIDRAANLYLVNLNQVNKATEIYAAYRDHWTVNESERFLYDLAVIEIAPSIEMNDKLEMMKDLIQQHPDHFFVPQVKHRMAVYARMLNDKNRALQLWKELSVLEGDQKLRFKSIVQSALLDLANYYLEAGDATTGESYLQRIQSEYSDSFAYQLATDMGFWKWPNEIRTGILK